jgi:hypothetical protein
VGEDGSGCVNGQSSVNGELHVVSVPRSARGATDLESENIAITLWYERDRMPDRGGRE